MFPITENKVILESTLKSSLVFSELNEMSPESIFQKAVLLIKNLPPVKMQEIESAYVQIKGFSNSLARSAIKEFDQGKIVLLYNKNVAQRMTLAVPFFTFKKQDDYVTYVFMDKYMSESKDGGYSVNTSALYDLLVSALISNAIKRNYNRLANSSYLEKTLCSLYTKFVTRIINREFSIISDKVLYDKVSFWIGKFFLTKIFETPLNETAVTELLKRDIRYAEELQINEMIANYNQANPQNVRDLIELIKTGSPRLSSLNYASFVSQWVNYFYSSALLGIDNIEYLIFMVICLLGGNNIISIAGSEMVKETKGILQFKPELLKLL